MAEVAENSILRRKLDAAKPGPALAAMTLRKALRFAVGRAAEQTLGCAVALAELAEERGPPEEVTASLPDPALLLRLEGPEAGIGLAVLCPQAVGAIIEAQTLGRVLSAPTVDRRPTRTDAILVSEFVDRLLAGFAALSAECRPAPPVAGFAGRGPVADLRTALLALRDAEHLRYTLSLDFGAGAKAGTLHLLLPAQPPEVAADAGTTAWARALSGAVMASPAQLQAILCRQRMPLSRVAGLAVGDLVRLDTAALDKVALCGSDGRTLLTARLGRSGALRAVRLVLVDGPSRLGQPEAAKAPATRARNETAGT